MDLVTFTYNGEKWWGLREKGDQAKQFYFTGNATNISNTFIKYYNYKSKTVSNSEIYNSIAVQNDSIRTPCVGINDIWHGGNSNLTSED